MTAPTDTAPAQAPAPTPANTATDPQAVQRAKLADLQSQYGRFQLALEGIPEDHPARAIIDERAAPIAAQIESLSEKIARADRLAAISRFTDPLIAAFGAVTVPTTAGIPAKIEVLDVEHLRNGAQEKLRSAQATLAILEHLEKAIKSAKIPEDALDDLKAIQVVADGEHSVKIAVATHSRVPGPGKGNGNTGRGELVKIVAANNADHVGKHVGPGGDWPNFRSMLAVASPEEYAHLEGRAGRYSAAKVLREKHGIVVEPVTAG